MSAATYTEPGLWVLWHPLQGVIYAQGRSSSEAYAVAVERLHGHVFDAEDPRSLAEKTKLRDDGWKAKRCILTVELT